MTQNQTDSHFFEGQLGHLIAVIVLVAAAYWATGLTGFADGQVFGLSTTAWFIIAVADTIIHQVYVWLCWRSELYGKGMTRTFGGNAFTLYAIGFVILFGARGVFAFIIGYANRGTLPIDPTIGYVLAGIIFLPAFYLFYSVKTYFSFRRAFGIDHFEPEATAKLPFVRKGIFKWTPNAMYVFGFFLLWVPPFLFQSVAALVFAVFSHIYIWVHYFCTEKPDMRRIYGK